MSPDEPSTNSGVNQEISQESFKPILTLTSEFLYKFSNDPSAIALKAAKTQDFYQRVNDHLKLLRLDEAAIFRWLTDIETFVMEQLYPLAFAPEDCNDFEMDEKIYTRLELLSKINLQNLLEAHPIMKSPIKETVQESGNQCDLEKAINQDFDKDFEKTADDDEAEEEREENLGILFTNNHAHIDFTVNPQIMIKLIEFHHERAPFRKIQRLTEIFKILGNPSNTEDGNILNTDTLLPLLIVHIVKTNPPRLISNIRFCQRFRNKISHQGLEAFSLATFVAAVSFTGSKEILPFIHHVSEVEVPPFEEWMRKHEAEVKPKRNMAVKAHSMRDLLLNREYSPRQTRKANNEGVSGPSTISFIMEELGSLFGKNSTDFDMKIMKNNFDPKDEDLLLKRTTLISYQSGDDLPVKEIPFLWSDYCKLIQENVKLHSYISLNKATNMKRLQ